MIFIFFLEIFVTSGPRFILVRLKIFASILNYPNPVESEQPKNKNNKNLYFDFLCLFLNNSYNPFENH